MASQITKILIVLLILLVACDRSSTNEGGGKVILEWEIMDRFGEIQIAYDTLSISKPKSYKLDIGNFDLIIPELDSLLVEIGDMINIDGFDFEIIHKDVFQVSGERLVKKIIITYNDKGIGFIVYESEYGVIFYVPFHGVSRKRLIGYSIINSTHFHELPILDSLTNIISNDPHFFLVAPPIPVPK